MKPLDAMDKRILRVLQENADLTNKEIANQLGLSVTPVYERIKRMKRTGIIKRIIAEVDRDALGENFVAFCNVILNQHSTPLLAQFEREVSLLKEVKECFHIAGKYDYLLKVIVSDMNAYHYFVTKKLASLENINQVQSSFVMNEIK